MDRLGIYVHMGVEDKQVLLLFSQDAEGSVPANISQWRIDPKECIAISEAMATSAFEADTELKPVGPALKATLVENHRMKLMQRVSVMMNTLRHDNMKTDGMVARDIIDVIFKEIF